MSKALTSQVMQQTCDSCGEVKTWELVGAEMNEPLLEQMQEWYIVTRKVIQRGQLTAIAADACSLACVPGAAVKLALPSADMAADNIDLAALRAANYQQPS
jgi:hypothetical protein